MSRPNPLKLALVLAGLTSLGALPVWLKGGLYLTNFEGDALHLADIVLRMAGGEGPHRDFMTPIGALAFWPVAVFVRAGLDLGHAFAAAQAVVAALGGAAIWYAAVTRLPKITAYLFGAASVAVLSSLAHGYDTPNLAVSMHYNRWAWGLAFAAIIVAVLPSQGPARHRAEGVLLALLVAAMAFLKITYAVALAPALALILLARGATGTLLAALVAGAVLAALAMIVPGYGFVATYLGDLRAALAAPLRDAPGLGLQSLLVSPAYLAPTAILFAGGLWLRRAGRPGEGLALLLLLPAVTVITWQNFGNDPLWLIPVAAILAAIAANDPGALRPIGAGAVIAAALAIPPVVVHGGSGVRLLTIDENAYRRLVPDRAGLGDIYIASLPAQLVRARTVLNDAGAPFEAVPVDRTAPVTIAGEALPECQLMTGLKATLEVLASETESDGPLFVADILSSHWLYAGDPLPGAAPWNYGTLHGLEAASGVLVPLCPVNAGARRAIFRALEDRPMSVLRRTPRYLLLRIE